MLARWLAPVALFTMVISGAHADPVADFYRGKQLKLIVGYGPGGGYDVYARLLARHLGKYIPGNPQISPRNMPGAAGVVNANFIFNQAKPDGLTLGVNTITHFTSMLTNLKGTFAPQRFRMDRAHADRPDRLLCPEGLAFQQFAGPRRLCRPGGRRAPLALLTAHG
jgi:tripartite-type tricarboxylate transporter receptor subunit TctC